MTGINICFGNSDKRKLMAVLAYWEISVTNESKFDALPSILHNKADGFAFISVLFCRSSLSFAESYVSQFSKTLEISAISSIAFRLVGSYLSYEILENGLYLMDFLLLHSKHCQEFVIWLYSKFSRAHSECTIFPHDSHDMILLCSSNFF